jgi:hypothetical protein
MATFTRSRALCCVFLRVRSRHVPGIKHERIDHMSQRPVREPPTPKKTPLKEPPTPKKPPLKEPPQRPQKEPTPIGDPPKKRRPHTDARCS